MDAPKQMTLRARHTVRVMFPKYEAPLGNFTIQGSESQILHVQLSKGETILVESGGMRYLAPGITPQAKLACCCGCEELWRVAYTNNGDDDGALIGIAPPYNANVIPINLDTHPGMVIRGGTFLAAQDPDLQILTRRTGTLTGAASGTGALVHPLVGKGVVFLHAGGTIMNRTLRPNEVLYASAGALVAYQERHGQGVTVSVEAVGGGVTNWCCGGQGLLNTKLVGPGLVVLQSLSLSELRAALWGVRAQQQQCPRLTLISCGTPSCAGSSP